MYAIQIQFGLITKLILTDFFAIVVLSALGKVVKKPLAKEAVTGALAFCSLAALVLVPLWIWTK